MFAVLEKSFLSPDPSGWNQVKASHIHQTYAFVYACPLSLSLFLSLSLSLSLGSLTYYFPDSWNQVNITCVDVYVPWIAKDNAVEMSTSHELTTDELNVSSPAPFCLSSAPTLSKTLRMCSACPCRY